MDIILSKDIPSTGVLMMVVANTALQNLSRVFNWGGIWVANGLDHASKIPPADVFLSFITSIHLSPRQHCSQPPELVFSPCV